MRSKSEVCRLIKAGAVDVDGETIKDPNLTMEVYSVIKIGKKTFKKAVFYRDKFKNLIYDLCNENTI